MYRILLLLLLVPNAAASNGAIYATWVAGVGIASIAAGSMIPTLWRLARRPRTT